MAIFTSEADKDISLLTWAAQVEGGELIDFIRARADPKRHEAEFMQWQQEVARVNEEVRQKEAARERLSPGGVGLEMLKGMCDPRMSLRKACNLTREVLSQIADEGTIKYGHIRRVLALSSHLSQPLLFTGADEKNLLAGEVSFQPRAATGLAADVLALRVLLELQGLFPDKVGFVKRCEECRNPFVRYEYNPQQLYCSDKCSSKSRMRRWRNEKKEHNADVALKTASH